MDTTAAVLLSVLVIGAIGAVLCAVGYGVYRLVDTLNSLLLPLRKIARLSAIILKNKDKIESNALSMDDLLKGANKINQDAVDTNIALVNTVVKLTETVENLKNTLLPPTPTAAEMTPEYVRASYEKNVADLIEQGFDREQALVRAAEWELENLSSGISSNLGFGE
jgi:hypothetical protein